MAKVNILFYFLAAILCLPFLTYVILNFAVYPKGKNYFIFESQYLCNYSLAITLPPNPSNNQKISEFFWNLRELKIPVKRICLYRNQNEQRTCLLLYFSGFYDDIQEYGDFFRNNTILLQIMRYYNLESLLGGKYPVILIYNCRFIIGYIKSKEQLEKLLFS